MSGKLIQLIQLIANPNRVSNQRWITAHSDTFVGNDSGVEQDAVSNSPIAPAAT
jgi:hypothetical protein